jgi:prevent-host-death family protein
MTDISIRELKTHTSAVMRTVQRQKSPVRVTCRGKAVGIILPLEQAQPTPNANAHAWAQFLDATEEVGKRWKSPKTAIEVVTDMRR